MTGHSLGGAVASMVGITFGIPTVTFEVPGDRLASTRLHLPHAPGARLPIWHFGHTADPIFVGVCTVSFYLPINITCIYIFYQGPSSSCWYGGYAMETRCHTGKVCVWDTVNDKGWRVDIRSHRVGDVIENILLKPEEFPMPICEEETDCEDCGLWQYFDVRDEPFTKTTESTTTTDDTTTTSEGVSTTLEDVTTTSEDASTSSEDATTTTASYSDRLSF